MCVSDFSSLKVCLNCVVSVMGLPKEKAYTCLLVSGGSVSLKNRFGLNGLRPVAESFTGGSNSCYF